MSTYTRILYHLVFGSKDYASFLTPYNEEMLYKYVIGILKNKLCPPYIIGGYQNHIHIVSDLHPSVALSDLIRDIKRSTSAMMKTKNDDFQGFFGWQVGYGAFTYSSSSLKSIIKYVSNQEVHHRKESYKEELINLCIQHGIPYDDKYILK